MAQSDSSKQGLTPQDELRSASRQIYAVSSALLFRGLEVYEQEQGTYML